MLVARAVWIMVLNHACNAKALLLLQFLNISKKLTYLSVDAPMDTSLMVLLLILYLVRLINLAQSVMLPANPVQDLKMTNV